jgi:hypothetical protein
MSLQQSSDSGDAWLAVIVDFAAEDQANLHRAVLRASQEFRSHVARSGHHRRCLCPIEQMEHPLGLSGSEQFAADKQLPLEFAEAPSQFA